MVLILFQLRYQKLLDANPTTPTNNKTEKNKVKGVGDTSSEIKIIGDHFTPVGMGEGMCDALFDGG